MNSVLRARWRLDASWRNDGTIRHAAFMFVGTMSLNVASFLMFVILGRLIPVRDYGELLSLLSIVMIVSVPVGLLQPVITRVAAEITAGGDGSALRRLSRSLTWPFAGVGCAIIVVTTIARDPIATYFHIEHPITVVVAGILLAKMAVLPIQRAILQGGQRYGEYSLSQIIEAVVKLSAVPALAFAGFGVAGALTGYVASGAASFLFNAWMVRLRFGPPASRINVPWRRLFVGARRMALVTFTLTVLSLYDVVIVKHAFGPQDAGVYSAAAVVGRALLAVVAFVPALILPKVSLAFARGETTAHFLRGGMVATLVPVVLALVLVISMPDIILRIMAGPAFSAAAPLVVPLSLSAALLAVSGTLAAYLTARKSFDFVLPLCGLALTEIVTVALWHPSFLTVARTVALGHAALLLTLAVATAWDLNKVALKVLPQEAGA